MSASTARLGLTKPGGGSTGLITPADIVDIDVLNANFDKIDASLGYTIATSGARPSIPFNGQPIFETDTKNEMYWSTSAGRWIPIGIPNAASVALRGSLFPAPVGGEVVYRTDKLWYERYNATGALWQPFGVSKVVTYAGASAGFPIPGPADVAGSTYTFTVEASTSHRIVCEFGGKISLSATSTANLFLNVDGADVRSITIASGSGTLLQGDYASQYEAVLASGSHTIKLRGGTNAGVTALSGGFLVLRWLDVTPSP